MTLKEIETWLHDLSITRDGESWEEYAERYWEQKPRIPYRDLPSSLQKKVRERHSVDNLHEFFKECYTENEFEKLIEGFTEEQLTKIIIRARILAVYDIEYLTEYNNDTSTAITTKELVPYLYGNEAFNAFESALAEFRNTPKYKGKGDQMHRKYKSKSNINKRQKRLVSAGAYQFVISDKKYSHALTPHKNNSAYISVMTPEFFSNLDFSRDGLLYDTDMERAVKKGTDRKYESLMSLDIPLLTQLYTAAAKTYLKTDSQTITVYIPDFCREMGVDYKSASYEDFIAKIDKFKYCVGIIQDKGIIADVFRVSEINLSENTMTFSMPYIFRVIDALEENNTKSLKPRRSEEKITYLKPYHNHLVHSTIANERNKAAVELVYLITNGLLQRGTTPDAQTWARKKQMNIDPDVITYRVTFRTLIRETSLLSARIKNAGNNKQASSMQNQALRRAFEKAYSLLQEKTDSYKYFIDLQMSGGFPTMTTLDNEITFTFYGIDGNYKSNI